VAIRQGVQPGLWFRFRPGLDNKREETMISTLPIGRKRTVFVGILLAALGVFAALGDAEQRAAEVKPSAPVLAVVGGTVIDGTGAAPLEDAVILVENGRIASVAKRGQVPIPKKAVIIDASGKTIIPGLVDGNAHFTFGTSVEYLARYEGRYEDLIEEAAQVALKAGVTTCFDTWGPLPPLLNVRNRINGGETIGSRMFVAGNIIGFSGPLGRDFNPDSSASPMFRKRINALWEQNVGPELGLLRPDEVGQEIRKYASLGPDFLKYGSSGHSDDRILLFSGQAQKAIVEAGHAAKLTVQCHTTNVESARIAIEAGVDILTHADITENEPLPGTTIAMIKEKGITCGILPYTKKKIEARLKRFADNPAGLRSLESRNLNVSHFLEAGIPVMMTTDAGIWSPEVVAGMTGESRVDRLDLLGKGHWTWCRAMAERGLSPMEILLSATRNVARAYHKLDEFGTLERGKAADLVILDADPMRDIDNLEKIFLVIKDGRVIDRDKLPLKKVVELPDL
jgi:imidazolonepropionase-like amidohydrolase